MALRSRDAALLGAVQGLTEFLPISSSAHMAILRASVGMESTPRAVDVALHLGTTAALLIMLRGAAARPPLALAADALRHRARWSRYQPASRAAATLGMATLPAIAAGVAGRGCFERWGERRTRLAISLVAGSLPMLLAERFRSAERSCRHEEVAPAVALAMGLAQAAALTPGISRSGATIAAGMACGLDRESAARYSFLLAVPVTVAAAARELPALRRLYADTGAGPLLVGIGSALAGGLVGLGVMSRLVSRLGLAPFALYRLALAGALWASVNREAATPPKPTRARPD